MVNKSVGLIAVLIILFCTLNLELAAQSCKVRVSCSWYSWDSGCLPRLPPTATNCTDCGPFCAVCEVATYHCPPAPECANCTKAGSPISLATGNTWITQTDLSIPGLGGGLRLVRTWNSVWPAPESAYFVGNFGPGWRSTFEERIFAGSDGFVKYSRGDGTFWSFGYSSTSNNENIYAVASPANEPATLRQGTIWTLTFNNGEQRTFGSSTGELLAITDRNGNATQLAYDSSNRLTTVTDPAGRHLSFSYASPSSYLVTSVSSDIGLGLSYSYDAQGRLMTVTGPDNTTTSFQYANDSVLISAVVDGDGRVLESHTYNSCGQGLTSSRSGGIEAVAVSYPPSCGVLPPK